MNAHTVRGTELGLGDIVDLRGVGTYSHATVKQLTDTEITFFRPYVATADFSWSGGVLCYVGIEEFKASRNGEYLLLQKGSPLK